MEKDLGNLRAQRVNLTMRVNELLFKWRDELHVMIEAMNKRGLPFLNPRVDGSTRRGVLIGDGFMGDKRVLYVHDILTVRAVDPVTDEYCSDTIETADFAETHDLDTVKAGFDSVRNMHITAIKLYHERNVVIKAFLEANEHDDEAKS